MTQKQISEIKKKQSKARQTLNAAVAKLRQKEAEYYAAIEGTKNYCDHTLPDGGSAMKTRSLYAVCDICDCCPALRGEGILRK